MYDNYGETTEETQSLTKKKKIRIAHKSYADLSIYTFR